MTIEVVMNGKIDFTSEVALLHDVKSEYGKKFYHNPDVTSIEVLMDGIPFLQLQKDDSGKVTFRYDMKSED